MRITDTDSPQAISERVAAEVRAEIARQGLNQASMATRLGWSQPFLSRRLAGVVALSVGELVVIADNLGVPVAQFFPSSALARVA